MLKRGQSYEELSPGAADVVRAGPQVDQKLLDACRYWLTGQLDDLADAVDAAERALLHGAAFVSLAEFLLLAHHQWIAMDKWLIRALRAWDAETANSLCAALVSGDRSELIAAAMAHLEPFGGPLRAGFVRCRKGERTPAAASRSFSVRTVHHVPQ